MNGAKIELTAEGGFAALLVTHTVRHDDRGFVFTQRHICNAPCPAPLDSASGVLTPAATDSLFNIVLGQDPFSLKEENIMRVGAELQTWLPEKRPEWERYIDK